MALKISLLLLAFLLSACTQIKIKDAETTNRTEFSGKRLHLKYLNKEARTLLNAKNPDDLIVVYSSTGVILYGDPSRKFKIEKDATIPINITDTNNKNAPVNKVYIETFENSPLCQSYYDGAGNRLWYPSDCPK